MKKRLVVSTIIIVLLASSMVYVSKAQEASGGRPLWVIDKIVIKSEKAPDFLQWAKEYNGITLEHSDVMRGIVGQIHLSNSYFYAMPLVNFAGLDAWGAEERMVGEKYGIEEWQAFSSKFDEYVEEHSRQIWLELPEFHYLTGEHELSEEHQAAKFMFLYPYPSQNQQAIKFLARAKELHEKYEVDLPTRIYTLLFGEELPVYLVTWHGKNPTDIHMRTAEAFAQMGEEWESFLEESATVMRKVEFVYVQYHLDLTTLSLAGAVD